MNAYHTWSIMEPIRAIYFIVHVLGQCSKPMLVDDRELYQPIFWGIIKQQFFGNPLKTKRCRGTTCQAVLLNLDLRLGYPKIRQSPMAKHKNVIFLKSAINWDIPYTVPWSYIIPSPKNKTSPRWSQLCRHSPLPHGFSGGVQHYGEGFLYGCVWK